MTPAPGASEAGELFRAYHDRIHRYIVGLVQDRAEAEDLTQDTFLRAFRRADSLRDPNAVRGWLYRIATHVCLDRLRQRVPHVRLDGKEGARRAGSLVSESPSALEVAERGETSACVQRCLDFLPDSHRAVILLYEAHSLAAAQIAELLGVNLATVKIRLHRARRRLQTLMEIGCAVSRGSRGVPCCEPRSDVARTKEFVEATKGMQRPGTALTVTAAPAARRIPDAARAHIRRGPNEPLPHRRRPKPPHTPWSQ